MLLLVANSKQLHSPPGPGNGWRHWVHRRTGFTPFHLADFT